MTQDITHTPISTLSERIKKTPKNNSKRGFWTGPRGESTYIPIDCQIEINHLLKQFGIIGIISTIHIMRSITNWIHTQRLKRKEQSYTKLGTL